MVYTYSVTKAHLPSRWSLVSILSIGVFAASSGAIFIRLAHTSGISSIAIAAGRLVFASIFLTPIIIVKYIPTIRILSKKEWLLSFLAGLFLSAHFAFWISSLEYTSITSSVIFVSTTPIWVLITSLVFFHERINSYFIIGLATSFLGSIIIGLSDVCLWQSSRIICPPISQFIQNQSLFGDILSLFGAFSAAGYLILGRNLRNKLPVFPYVFIVYSIAGGILALTTIMLKKTIIGLPATSYLWILLLALIPQLLGHTIFNWTLKFLPASYVSLSLLGEPIGSSLLALLIFTEIPGWFKTIGLILLLFGIWISGSTRSPFPQ